MPVTKLAALQKVLQSDFLSSVREVYEHVYETVDIQGSQVLNIKIMNYFHTDLYFNHSFSFGRMFVRQLQLKQPLLRLLLVKVMPIQEWWNCPKQKKDLDLM